MFSHSTPIIPRGSFQVACEIIWESFGVGDHFGSCTDLRSARSLLVSRVKIFFRKSDSIMMLLLLL